MEKVRSLMYTSQIILLFMSPFRLPSCFYTSSVTRNRKRTENAPRGAEAKYSRRRSRMTACRSDRHAFETLYVVKSGVHRRWQQQVQSARWSISHRAHWTRASYGKARVPCKWLRWSSEVLLDRAEQHLHGAPLYTILRRVER